MAQTVPAASQSPPNFTPVALDKILREIHNRLLLWMGTLTFVMILFTALLVSDKFSAQNQVDATKSLAFHAGSYNESIFNIGSLGTLTVIMVVGLVILSMIGGYRISENSPLAKWQLQIFILISVILVVIYIFVTGGFLDSPFTSALSIYIGGFLILQERTDTKKFNRGLMIITTLLILTPYVYLYISGKQMFFFSWKTDERHLTFIRFWIVLLATGFSIWQADRINKKIEQIYRHASASGGENESVQ